MTISQTITGFSDTAPLRTDPANFDSRADTRMTELDDLPGEINTWAEQANALATTVNSDKTDAQSAKTDAESARDLTQQYRDTALSAVASSTTSATSTTSIAFSTGSKTLTIQTGKDFVVGMNVVIAHTSSPTNYMAGIVTGYNSETGELTVNVSTITGSGTQSAWTISLAGVRGLDGNGLGCNVLSNQPSDITLTSSDDQAQVISFDDFGYSVTLPDAMTLQKGLAFTLLNDGNYPFGVRDSSGTLINTVDASQTLYCYLSDNSSADGAWAFDPIIIRAALQYETVAFNSVDSSYNVIINLDDSTAIVVYRNTDDANNRGEAVAISTTDGSVLDGPIALNAVNTTDIAACKLSTTDVFICYGENYQDLWSCVVRYSGGTLSLVGGPTELCDGITLNKVSCCALDSSHVAVSYSDDDSSRLLSYIVNWNGTDTIAKVSSLGVISSSKHIFLECIAIDSTNWLCCAELESNNDLTAYSINWDGVNTISLNETATTLQNGTIDSTPQLSLLEDDGTYLWIGCVSSVSSSSPIIEVIKITKATKSVQAYSSYNDTADIGYDFYSHYAAFVIGTKFCYVTAADNIAIFDWDTSEHSLTKQNEYALQDLDGSYYSFAKIGTNKALGVFRNSNNNFYGSSMVVEIAS